jgi:hypothetical protein
MREESGVQSARQVKVCSLHPLSYFLELGKKYKKCDRVRAKHHYVKSMHVCLLKWMRKWKFSFV